MTTETAGAGLCEVAGFAAVPRIQIVAIADAMALRDRAVKLPARLDSHKRAAREEDGSRQKAMGL